MVVYAGPDPQSVRWARWDGPLAGFAASEAGPADLDGDIVNLVFKRSPIDDEGILALSTSAGSLYVFLWNGSAFVNVDAFSLGAIPTRHFDVEYDILGRGLVAYGDGAQLRLLTRIQGAWGVSPGDSMISNATISWVDLVASPDADGIGVVVVDGEREIQGYVWTDDVNGIASTRYTDPDKVSDNTLGAATMAWSAGKPVILFGNHLTRLKIITRDTAWTVTQEDFGGDSVWVRTASQPGGDKVAATLMLRSSSLRFLAKDGATYERDSLGNHDAPDALYRSLDVVWHPATADEPPRDRAHFVYVDLPDRNLVNWCTWSGGTLACGTLVEHGATAGTIRWLQAHAPPGTNETLVLVVDDTGRLSWRYFHGAAWNNAWGTIDDGLDSTRETFGFAF